jgi:hypothetical protein
MKINNNAIEVLGTLMEQRGWYADKIERRKANTYKTLLGRGKLSYQQAVKILDLLGWKKIKEETWQLVK